MKFWSQVRRPCFAVLAALVLASCDSDEGPDLTGFWVGALEGSCAPVLSVSITESTRHVITGTATLASPASCGFASIDYSVSDEHDHPRIVMTFEPNPGQGFSSNRSLSGSVSGADSIVAMFDETPVTLVRQVLD